MAKSSTPRRSRSEKVHDVRSIERFLEELSWLLSSHAQLDFRKLADVRVSNVPSADQNRLRSFASKNPNIHFLIGALPKIFSDEKIFPNNEDIVEFSMEAMNLPIARWEKRSRYELIGLIVCETAKLNDERLHRLVHALARIASDDPNAQKLFRNRKQNRLSWNEVIQRVSSDAE